MVSMNNKTLPAPLKAQLIKYGQNKGTDFNGTAMNRAENRMIAALDSVEGNLNHLSDALKTRFKTLLISQLSLLRYKDVNTDKNISSLNEIQRALQKSPQKEEQIYIKRCSLKSVHFADSSQGVYGQRTMINVSGTEEISDLENKRKLAQNGDPSPIMDSVGSKLLGFHSSSKSCFKRPTYLIDYNTKPSILGNSMSPSPTAVNEIKRRSPDLCARNQTITASNTRFKSPQSPVRLLKDSYFSSVSAFEGEVTNKRDLTGLTSTGGSEKSSVDARINDYLITTSSRTNPSVPGQSKGRSGPTKAFSPKSSMKCPIPRSQPRGQGGAMPKSPIRVSLSSQLKSNDHKHVAEDTNLSMSGTHGNAKRRNRPRTQSNSPKEVAQSPRSVQSANIQHVSPTTDRHLSTSYETPKGAYIELSQHSLNMHLINKREDITQAAHKPIFDTIQNQRISCNTNTAKHVEKVDVAPIHQELGVVTEVDGSHLKPQVTNRGTGNKPRSQLGHNTLEAHSDLQSQLHVHVRSTGSKRRGHIGHTSMVEAHPDLQSPLNVRSADRDPRGHSLEPRPDLQLQKKLLLNAIRTLICVTHDALQRMMEEDFDLGIWTAIHKNVSGVEAELEKFSATFVSDDILPPETAVREAEDRLKTRLGVLFSLNNGRNRFLTSKATRQDIMDSVDLLKSTSFKYGASTQNEMLLSEMKHVVKEIKNLAEVFQVCGERFSKRLKGGLMRNRFHSVDRGVGFSLFLKKCFLGGRTGDEERVDDDNNHCIKRSSSLEALADMCSSVFDRVSDVQKALIILLFVGLVVYVVTEFLSGACGTIRAIGDMWNNLYILRCGPPPI